MSALPSRQIIFEPRKLQFKAEKYKKTPEGELLILAHYIPQSPQERQCATHTSHFTQNLLPRQPRIANIAKNHQQDPPKHDPQNSKIQQKFFLFSFTLPTPSRQPSLPKTALSNPLTHFYPTNVI